MNKLSIKEAILAILSKSATFEEATKEFSVDELNKFAYVLEKAKFISPEQQKANRLKAKQQANQDALDEANIQSSAAKKSKSNVDIKYVGKDDEGDNYHVFRDNEYAGMMSSLEQPFHGVMNGVPDDIRSEVAEKVHAHASKLSHRQIQKEPGNASKIASNPDGDFHEDQYQRHSYVGNHAVAEAHRALSDNFGGPKQGTLHPLDVSKHQQIIKDYHAGTKGGLKVVKADLEKAINKKTGDGRYGKPNPDVEICKFDKNGQWSLDKAVKPGPPLDYSKFNQKPDYADIEAKAPTIDYQNNSATKKPTWTGASDKAAQVRSKIDAESKETAVETIARRQKAVGKSEGTNSEPELAADKQKRMVAKNEMMGYGLSQSESEPHKDDPHHEDKEKKKAKKIKAEAEDLLDMHE